VDHTERSEPGRRSSNVLYGLAAVAVLYLGRPVLVPVALAILLAFIVAPLVRAVQRLTRSRVLAIAVVAVTLLAVGVGGAAAVGQGVVSFAGQLPTYRETILRKIRAIRTGPGRPLGRAAETIRGIGEEILGPPVPQQEAPAPAPTAEPASVAWSVLQPAARSAGTAGIVLLLLVMVLHSMESIRDRAIRLAGLHQIALTTQTLEEAGARVGRYLRSQLLINSLYAGVISLGLLFLGIPSAFLCGVLAGALRFAPFIGPWLGAAFPAALALAVFDDWHHVAGVLALFAGVELVVNLVLEPWLYGSSTGLSPLGVVLAIVFWTWVWGAVGLVLATPMTACLIVFARQIPQLGVLWILLGDEPALTEPTRFYQRLLCRDEPEAGAVLAASPGDRGPLAAMDDIMLPSLAAARLDAERGLISTPQAASVAASARDLAIEWLEDQEGAPTEKNDDSGLTVAVLPVADAADEAAGAVLAWILQREGIRASTVPVGLLFGERLAAAQAPAVGLVVCSSFRTGPHLRRTLRALRRRSAHVIVALWSSGETLPEQSEVVRSMSEALPAVRTALAAPTPPPAADGAG
jgi:predicted PurR-regulated permease PerM